MLFKFYTYREDWIGWLENPMGQVIGFIKADGSVVFDW